MLEETLDDHAAGVPAAQRALQGERNRYGYAGRPRLDGRADGRIKHDLVAGTTVEHDYGQGPTTLEPVFVPGGWTDRRTTAG